jgi:phosphatidate cytidylyltransferase
MLVTRIITGVVFGAAITGAILFAPSPVTAAILAVLWLAGVWEWAGFAKFEAAGRVGYTGLFAVAMAIGWSLLGEQGLSLLLVAALAWWILALVLVVRYPRSFSPVFVALAGIVVLLPSWALLVRLHRDGVLGAQLAFTLLIIVWAADVGAYAFGRLLGRTKLAPAVSPGKTWEGVAGALAGVAVYGIALSWIAHAQSTPITTVFDSALGAPVIVAMLALAALSVVGDLLESWMKRGAGVKDSSALLPGHGGILDRIDALTSTLPIAALALSLRVGGP